jgi:hypothetical protein
LENSYQICPSTPSKKWTYSAPETATHGNPACTGNCETRTLSSPESTTEKQRHRETGTYHGPRGHALHPRAAFFLRASVSPWFQSRLRSKWFVHWLASSPAGIRRPRFPCSTGKPS